jgi:intraflagellar transport protein 52
VLFQFLTGDLSLNAIDASDPEISDNHPIPDHMQLASQLKVCLQEGEMELPTRDLTKLFDGSLHAMDLAMLPKCMRFHMLFNFVFIIYYKTVHSQSCSWEIQ